MRVDNRCVLVRGVEILVAAILEIIYEVLMFINMATNVSILPTVRNLQQGVYFSSSDYPRRSFSIAFLRGRAPLDPARMKETLLNLWETYTDLQKRCSLQSEPNGRVSSNANPSVLFGYGPKFFEVPGLKKAKPLDFCDKWLFQHPTIGADPVIPDSGLRYASDVKSNSLIDDHVAIQFIGDTQMATHMAIVDTWKVLKKAENNGSPAPFVMTSFYTGFNRPDGRGWLGFHDGISNIKSSERLRHILVDNKRLEPIDFWTANGTYMSFLRIVVDLNIWESIPVNDQERIVGRQKATGCPLIKVDRRGNNIFISGCPVPGTTDITEKGNNRFRDYVPIRPPRAEFDASVPSVENSHVEQMRRISNQIFRQGYEFVESIEEYPFFQAGLNFVSFQGSTDRIYRMLKYGFRHGGFGGGKLGLALGSDRLLAVKAAGLFFVPPFNKNEGFPGEIIFDDYVTPPSMKKPIFRFRR